MLHVDALSRAIAYVNAMLLEKLEYRQLQDPVIKAIANELKLAGSEKFELFDGLYRKAPDRPRFVIPESMVNIIRTYHNEMAYCEAEKTFQGINTTYWFPSRKPIRIRKKMRDHIAHCLICLMTNISQNQEEGEMQFISKKPFETLYTV